MKSVTRFDQTALLVAGLESLWTETLGDPRICIAVLDGPVDLAHPCFAGAQLTEIETLVSAGVGQNPASEHGTHVASVIFGQHGSPVRGVAPRCRGLILPIYSSGGGDSLSCSQLDLARAINLAVANGAQVINISGGELAQSAAAEPILAEAIKRCSDSGVVIVAAAGNNGCRCLHVPAAVPSVLAVGAMDAKGAPLEFSNWGEAYQSQGVLALGERIPGAVPGGDIARKSGTSFATPIVSGIVGLLLSLQRARGVKPDPLSVRAALLETAEPCDPAAVSDCARLLAGRLDLPAAQARLLDRLPGAVISQAVAARVCPAVHLEGQTAASVTEPGYPAPAAFHFPPHETPIQTFPASTIDRPGVTKSVNNTHLEYKPIKKEEVMPSESLTTTPDPQPASTVCLAANDPSVRGIRAADSPPESVREPAPQVARAISAVMPSAIEAAGCATCAGQKSAGDGGSPALVYALGQIGYDFGTEARRDSFTQQTGLENVNDPAALGAYLATDPASAANIIWTLSLDATVVYAIQPFGPYASTGYDRLREALNAQITSGVERVSIPGRTSGSVRLLNGQQVPVIYPEVRGMYSWSTPELVKAVHGSSPTDEAAEDIWNFLERIYYELRNLGITPQERAMNYAATNAFQTETVFSEAAKRSSKLDTIAVEKSPICRPESDCWDVKLTFFHPLKRIEQARHVYRFTVDVSDVVPVTVGKVRHWDVY